MGITNSNKEVNVSQITCGGTFQVTLGLSAAPDISENPVDIVLVLDRSGSMAGSPLENLKLGADTFIDIIDETNDSTQDGQIGSGSHIGIVSFSSSASCTPIVSCHLSSFVSVMCFLPSPSVLTPPVKQTAWNQSRNSVSALRGTHRPSCRL